MSFIDFILNAAGLLLWLSWRSVGFDPAARNVPATLAGTIKRAERHSLKAWHLPVGLVILLVARSFLYCVIGAPAGWTPKLSLGVVVLAFRGDQMLPTALYSLLSFGRVLIVFYFWLLVLASINRGSVEPGPLLKLLRLHLGHVARWPWPIGPLLMTGGVVGLWVALHPVLSATGVVAPAHSMKPLLQQSLLLLLTLVMTLKYILPAILLLYLIASYVYLGTNPFWEFISATAQNLLAPIRWLPLRFARVDLAPLAGVALIFVLLHWMPNAVQSRFAERSLTLWPQ